MNKLFITVALTLGLLAGSAFADARIFPGTSSGTYIPILGGGDKNGHKGYIPVDGAATVCEPGASSADYIETLQGIALDAITLTREEAIAFFKSNDQTSGEFPPEIVSVVLVNPYDKDWKGTDIYLSAYDKDGCYWGQAMWDVAHVKAGLEAIGYVEGVKQ